MDFLLRITGFQVPGSRGPLKSATETRNLTPLLTADSVLSCFQRRHFAEAPQVSLGLAEFGRQKRLDKVPSDCRSHRPAAHTKNVHMIVLDPLLCGEMVVD